MKIGLADADFLFREFVANYVQAEMPCNVVVSEGSGKSFIEQVDKLDTPPDLCVVDIRLPLVNGYDAVLHLRKFYPKMKVLVLTSIQTDYSIFTMIRMGVNGYLLKSCSKKELIKAILAIHNKGHYYSKVATKKHFDDTLLSDGYARISKKEKEFLALACTSLTFKEIGEKMGIGTRSVETHHESLNKKFNLKTRADLAIFAVRNGLIVVENNE